MSLKNIKLKTPEYDDVLPSTDSPIKFRPFTVAEEKLLLIASESKDTKQVSNSMKQIIVNCTSQNPSILPYYDVEYLFTKIRSKSVGEQTQIVSKCESCEEDNEVSIQLDDVKVIKNENHNKTIKISDELVFVFDDPTIDTISSYDENTNSVDNIVSMICETVKQVQMNEEINDVTPADKEDLKGLLEQLTTDQFQKISGFFDTMPKAVIDYEFECSKCKHINKARVEGMHNFF